MEEYLKEWEHYIAEHYKPQTMSREELHELYEIADIMKDLREYMDYKDDHKIGG